MKVQNKITDKSINIGDQLDDTFEEHYQRGIKSVTIAPLATEILHNSNAGESKGLQDLFNADVTTPGTGLKVVGKDEPTEVPGLVAGRGFLVFSGLVTFVGTTFQIAFGTDGGADLDQVAPEQEFVSADDYFVLLTLQSGIGVTITAKLTTDFTLTGTAADKVGVAVFRSI